MNRSRQPSRIRELETLILLALVSLVAGFITHQEVFFFAVVILLAIALFAPPLARAIARTWLLFGTIIGVFNNKLILSIVFYLFLTPIAFLYRRFTRNQMKLKQEHRAISFYSERNHSYDKADFEKMW